MACEYPWTNQDEYGVYSDCHIWAPFYLIASVLIICFGSISGGVAVWRLTKSSRRFLPAIALLANTLLVSVYIARAATGLVLYHRNVLLNFVFSVSGGLIWIFLGLVVLQYMEVVLLTEKLRGKTEHLLAALRRIFPTALAINFFATIFVFTAPCFINVSFPVGHFGLTACCLGSLSLLVYYYGLSLRRLLKSMEVSKSFYAGLVRRLDGFMIPWTILAIPSIVMCVLFLVIPFFFQNMYILVNTWQIIATPFVTLVLYITAPIDSSNAEALKSTAKSKSQSQGSSHGSHTHSMPESSPHPQRTTSHSKFAFPHHTQNTNETTMEMVHYASSSQLQTTSHSSSHDHHYKLDNSNQPILSPYYLPESPVRKGISLEDSPMKKGISVDDSPLKRGISIDDSPLKRGISIDDSPLKRGKTGSMDDSSTKKGISRLEEIDDQPPELGSSIRRHYSDEAARSDGELDWTLNPTQDFLLDSLPENPTEKENE